MKKIFITCVAVLASAQAFATITLNVAGADLRDENGNLMPTSGLILLVADTSSNGFAYGASLLGAPIASASTFLANDDWIVWRGELGEAYGEGFFYQPLAGLTLTGSWGQGAPLALYWFPSLTLASVTVPGGIWHGMYTTNIALDGTTVPPGGWFTPSDGSLINLTFLTASQSGSSPDFMGKANYLVPEPSAFMLVGMGLLATWFLRRYRR